MGRRGALLLVVVALALGGCENETDPEPQAPPDSAQLRNRLAEANDDNDRLRRELNRVLRRTQASGLHAAATIPQLGTLTWRCNDERRFAFTFRPEGASVSVEVSIDGETSRKMLNPGKVLTTPFVEPSAHLEWHVTYRHKPASISAGIFADPAVKRGACYVRNVTIERTEAPN